MENLSYFDRHRLYFRLCSILLLALVILENVYSQAPDVPERTDNNLIVASYNIKWFGQTAHDVEKLANVIQHFDVCGVLEVKNEMAIKELVHVLESSTDKKWGYVYGIRTHRPNGTYYEVYAVIWRKDRVQLGDGLISGVWDMHESFRNDPYIVSFKSKNYDFVLVLLHTRWSNDADGSRQEEVYMISEHIRWLKSYLDEKDFILLGDFNYSADSQQMHEMANNAHLIRIDPNQNSTFKKDFSGYASPYDHIYITEEAIREYMPNSSKIMDTTKLIYGSNDIKNMRKSKSELSDHLPVWAIFDVTKTDDD